MLGAPSNIAGAPSHSMKGQFCPSFKNLKNFFPLSEAFSLLHFSLPRKLPFSSLFRDELGGGLLLREASPPALRPICIRGRWPSS